VSLSIPSNDYYFAFAALAPLYVGTLRANQTVQIPVLASPRVIQGTNNTANNTLVPCQTSAVIVVWSYICDVRQSQSTSVAVGSGRTGPSCDPPATWRGYAGRAVGGTLVPVRYGIELVCEHCLNEAVTCLVDGIIQELVGVVLNSVSVPTDIVAGGVLAYSVMSQSCWDSGADPSGGTVPMLTTKPRPSTAPRVWWRPLFSARSSETSSA